MFSRDDGIRWHWTVGFDGTAWEHASFTSMMAGARGLNGFSVSIEHDLPCTKEAVPSEAMLKTSAQIVAAFCRFIGKKPDRNFIIGHVEDDTTRRAGEDGSGFTAWGGTSTHSDPVGGWPWKHYMDLVNEAYGGDEMTDAEKKQLTNALTLARESALFIEGMKLRIQGGAMPPNPGPKRSGWKTADICIGEPRL